MRKLLTVLALAGFAHLSAAAQDIKIALVTSKTGPFEAYAKQAEAGFQLGFEYATKGTMTVNGRKLVLLHKDDQLKPERAKALAAEAFYDDKADILVGSTSSATTLAMMPVAQEAKKLMVVDIAGADQITGEKLNRYVFRTGRSTAQEAAAMAVGISKPGVNIVTLAQDYAWGRDMMSSFKGSAEKLGAKVVAQEFAPIQATDFTAVGARLINHLKDQPGEKYVVVGWVGTSPLPKLHAMGLDRHGIKLVTANPLLPQTAVLKEIPGLLATSLYYHDFPTNAMNKWFVEEHKKRHNIVPDASVAFAFNAAVAIVQAIEKAGGADVEKLIQTMEGMTFDALSRPLTIRKSDHQALHGMLLVRYKNVPGIDYGVHELVKEMTPEEVDAAIVRKPN